MKQCDNRHGAHSSTDRWTHRQGQGAAALRHSCRSAQPHGGPGRVLWPKAPLAWVDQLPVPHHILTVLEMLTPCSPLWLPITLPVYAFIFSGDAHCFRLETLSSLCFTLPSTPTCLGLITSSQDKSTVSAQNTPPPASFHGSPVPQPCRYTASAQMLKTAFLQHPPQLPISSACLSPTVSPMQGHWRYPSSSGFPLPATLCTPLGPHCLGTGDTLPPRPQQPPSLCISESAMAPLRH